MTAAGDAPRIILPWAPRTLWPNGRAHWASKARAAARQRHDAAILCAGLPKLPANARPRLTLTFCAPSRTARYDLDGALASQKHALDAIAAALGVDDSRFDLVLERGGKGALGKAGGVMFEINPHEAPA